MRATGHGISAGIGKLGAFIGVFLFPVLQTSLGLRATLLLKTGVSVAGLALTMVLPGPARRSLDHIAAGPASPASAGRPEAPPTGATGLSARSRRGRGHGRCRHARKPMARPNASPTARPARKSRWSPYRVVSHERPAGGTDSRAGAGPGCQAHAVTGPPSDSGSPGQATRSPQAA
jgi:hypothetical protein